MFAPASASQTIATLQSLCHSLVLATVALILIKKPAQAAPSCLATPKSSRPPKLESAVALLEDMLFGSLIL